MQVNDGKAKARVSDYAFLALAPLGRINKAICSNFNLVSQRIFDIDAASCLRMAGRCAAFYLPFLIPTAGAVSSSEGRDLNSSQFSMIVREMGDGAFAENGLANLSRIVDAFLQALNYYNVSNSDARNVSFGLMSPYINDALTKDLVEQAKDFDLTDVIEEVERVGIEQDRLYPKISIHVADSPVEAFVNQVFGFVNIIVAWIGTPIALYCIAKYIMNAQPSVSNKVNINKAGRGVEINLDGEVKKQQPEPEELKVICSHNKKMTLVTHSLKEFVLSKLFDPEEIELTAGASVAERVVKIGQILRNPSYLPYLKEAYSQAQSGSSSALSSN